MALPPVARLPLLLLGMAALMTGVLAGLSRLAVVVPTAAAVHAGVHGPLMITAFLGTVISLERAVALGATGTAWPYLAPLAAGLGGVLLMLGLPLAAGQMLFVSAAAVLLAASGLLLRQQPALHLATLALGAGAWLAGNLTWLMGGAIDAAVPWWLAFLVLTIAGERLELTRFLPVAPGAQRLFLLVMVGLFAGLVVAFLAPGPGRLAFSFCLLALALWLLRQDIARRTVRQTGLTRYIALCLLTGYGWLALGGLLGLGGGFDADSPLRDATLHAVCLGFVFSMIFGHGPLILPAVARLKVAYHPTFYVPLMLLHASLAVRVAGDLMMAQGIVRLAAQANAAALALFVLTMIAGILRGRIRSEPGSASPRDAL
jgi:hypothetical protein